jgi:predicted extracellular nuclease
MNLECRGADDAEELTRQRDKLIAALAGIDADVVGLVEIENDTADVALSDLVAGLNDAVGAGSYDFVATGPIGTDAIRVALIYKPASVSPVGDYAILDSSVDGRFIDDKNRPVLAQSFMDNAGGDIVTVAVNHLKSKGSSCDDVSDPDTGDGSGNCNLTRTAAAEALVDWLATDPTGSGAGNFLVIGDLNAYDKEDPIDALVDGGYVDLVSAFLGEAAYSFVFDGQIGYLDHALANATLNDRVTGVSIWHINADEPDLINYDTSFKRPAQDAIYAPDAYRSSDHDPVIVGLDLCEATPPQFDTLAVTPDTLWPANHRYVDVSATAIVSDNFDPSPTVNLVSVTSNEPDNGEDDGNTVNDIVIVDDYEFKLRAERSGVGAGRTYTITYEATDSCGNSATASATVFVPLSQGG